MKNWKLLLITMITAMVLSACSSKTEPTDTTKAATSVQESINKDATVIDETKVPSNATVPFEEIVAVDNDECSIRITKLESDNMWGYTVKATLENKSPDKTYMFSVTGASVNGVQCDPFFASEVAPGKKSNNDISFSDSTLKENGVSDFSDIEILFRVYDSNDWSADSVAEEAVHVYPYGKDKATVFVREAKDSDKIILDNDYVTVIVTGYAEDDIWGYTANLFLVNKTDTEVMFGVDNASVNGYMIDPFFASSVMPNKCTFKSMSWGNSSLEENGIEKVTEIEFSLKAYDSSNLSVDPFAQEVITLTP